VRIRNTNKKIYVRISSHAIVAGKVHDFMKDVIYAHMLTVVRQLLGHRIKTLLTRSCAGKSYSNSSVWHVADIDTLSYLLSDCRGYVKPK
jgi:hypothetical protein